LSAFREAGLTYDEITQAILNDSSGGIDAKALREQLLKEVQADVAKQFTDRDVVARKQVLAEMQGDATRLAAQGDDYALVRESKSIPGVMALIEKTYDSTGEVLDVTEALKLVEDDLLEQALKTAGHQKVQAKLQPTPTPPPQQRPGMRTLTNRDTALPVLDRKARALAAFRGTLNK
jgi:hypothetical protein